ncbi:CehA/McbA family metallohydrolase [bacterium AH-315-P07]|nr:CehA/McbA family metallohydrolase [bacterium AH-315-P07]
MEKSHPAVSPRPWLIAAALSIATLNAPAQDLYIVDDVEPQPLIASAIRLSEALDVIGSSLAVADAQTLKNLADKKPDAALTKTVQQILDRYCLAMVNISAEARVKVIPGPATPILIQGGWRSFLIKVHNQANTNAELAWESPNADPALHRSSGQPNPRPGNLITPGQLANRFLEISLYQRQPMTDRLSGLNLEYAILQIYTTASGQREASLGFNIGQGTQDIGSRNAISILFQSKTSTKVILDVKDFDGSSVMASFIIRDNIPRLAQPQKDDYRNNRATSAPWEQPGITTTRPLNGIYPLPARRVAETDEYPDFFFQPQIYRQTGEHVYLPPGNYDVTYTRGPEYLAQTKTMTVPTDVLEHTETFSLKRWIHMAEKKWFSLDHHVHGGGCSHYESPAAGVNPAAMMRQTLGEDLNVACVLTWGPCWYHQKTFFEGEINPLSTEENLMRYDVEVSGFPSSHAGHLCLLRLTEDDYPGTTKIEEWPSWTLPVLLWGQSQNGVVGYSHSGWGLEPIEPTEEFPNLNMPKFDGIGANEYIMTVTHGATDFISAGDTPWNWELNIWYHTLNAGYRTAISGETDFPCIFDERIGMARSYTHLENKLDYDTFANEIKRGLNYVSDGRSHIYDFAIENTRVRDNETELRLESGAMVTVTAKIAAYLPVKQERSGARIQKGGNTGRPYWHVEKARIPDTRKVAVELVVNGATVDQTQIIADGKVRSISFDTDISKSSWVALKITYSAHTNPIYIIVDDEPVRGPKESIQWCRDAVDRCWEMKQPRIRQEEIQAAIAGYDHARSAYDKLLAEVN